MNKYRIMGLIYHLTSNGRFSIFNEKAVNSYMLLFILTNKYRIDTLT